MINTYIFDLDGVIVDTAKYHYLAWKKLAEQWDIEFTQQHNELLKGVSRVRSLEIILELGNKTLTESEFETALHQKNEEYLGYIHQLDESEILPNVVEILEKIRFNGGNIVLGSASKNAGLILEKLGLIKYFDAIVDGNDVTKAKPDPEVFLKGAQKVNAKPSEIVVFEDSIAGIQAANLAGMKSVGIGEKEVLKEADFVYKDFTEFDWNCLL